MSDETVVSKATAVTVGAAWAVISSFLWMFTVFERWTSNGGAFAAPALHFNDHSYGLGIFMIIAIVVTSFRGLRLAVSKGGYKQYDLALLTVGALALVGLFPLVYRGIGADGQGFDMGFVGLYCSLALAVVSFWFAVLRRGGPSFLRQIVHVALTIFAVAMLVSAGKIASMQSYAAAPAQSAYIACGSLSETLPTLDPSDVESNTEQSSLCQRAKGRTLNRVVILSVTGLGALALLAFSTFRRKTQ